MKNLEKVALLAGGFVLGVKAKRWLDNDERQQMENNEVKEENDIVNDDEIELEEKEEKVLFGIKILGCDFSITKF